MESHHVALLFPVGAHPDAIIGEDPLGIQTNLMPYVARVAASTFIRKQNKDAVLGDELMGINELSVFGNDYDTNDRTGVRD